MTPGKAVGLPHTAINQNLKRPFRVELIDTCHLRCCCLNNPFVICMIYCHNNNQMHFRI